MAQSRKERRQEERSQKKNQSKTPNCNYLSIVDIKSEQSFTYEISKEMWSEIENEPSLSPFPTEQISRFVAEKFGEESSIVTLVALVQRHLKESDVELIKVVKEQKHNSFVIVIDTDNYEKSKVDRPSFVFASSPKSNFNDANGFGLTIGQMYLETSNQL